MRGASCTGSVSMCNRSGYNSIVTHHNYDFVESGEEMVVESITEGQSGEDISSEEQLKHSKK